MRSRNIEGDLVCELDKSLITRFIICVTTWYITAVVDLTGSKEITMGVVYMEDLCDSTCKYFHSELFIL